MRNNEAAQPNVNCLSHSLALPLPLSSPFPSLLREAAPLNPAAKGLGERYNQTNTIWRIFRSNNPSASSHT